MISISDFNVIASLDLNPIKAKLTHKESGEGWSAEKANAVETEYRRFLYLMKTFPAEQTAPLQDVDTFWHYHILDTMKYAIDCEQVFGYFLHHYPYLGMHGEDSEQERQEGGDRMQELYEQTFGDSYDQAALTIALAGRNPSANDAAAPPDAGDQQGADRTAVSKQAAFCAAGTKQTAFCAAGTKQAAFCAAGAKQAAFCAAGAKQAAFCAAGTKQAAFCAAGTKQAAFCAAGTKQAAFCAASTKQAAFCAASTKQAAFCAAGTKQAAFCAAGTKQAAFCAAGTKQAAFCAASNKQAAFCAAGARQEPVAHIAASAA
jgi:hypothetical protein